MTAREFILSLSQKKLEKIYYKLYYKDDYMLADMDPIERRALCIHNLNTFLNQIKEKPKRKSKKSRENVLLPMMFYDLENDADIFKVNRIFDVFMIKKEEAVFTHKIKCAKSIADVHKKAYEVPYTSYSLMFVGRDVILDMDFLFDPEREFEYEFACALINELTFFGYDAEKCAKREKAEVKELNKRAKEAKEHPENLISGETVFADLENKLYQDSDMTADEIKKDKAKRKEQREIWFKLMDGIFVLNQNISAEVYNTRFPKSMPSKRS